MWEYHRNTPGFSLCGLNCCLCPRFRTVGNSRCPGCGGPAFSQKHPSCAVVTCSRRHGDIEYCFQCRAFPCIRYTDENTSDSFITYQNVRSDLVKAKTQGLQAYLEELEKKSKILDRLLGEWDNGRQKSFYCLAVNLLPLDILEAAMEKLTFQQKKQAIAREADFRERCKEMEALLRSYGNELGISLALRK